MSDFKCVRILKLFSTKSYWKTQFAIKKAARYLLSALGILWLLIEGSSFFFPQLGEILQSFWYLFLIVGFFYALYCLRPQLEIVSRLIGRDVEIQIQINNMFKLDGAYVIGINSTFDTDLSLISKDSLQGKFAKQYYDNDVKQLDTDIQAQLQGHASTHIPNKVGKQDRYSIGTTVRLAKNAHLFYLVAISHLNEHGSAYGSFNELQDSFAHLWSYIGDVAGHNPSQPIVIPVLGTGFTRLTQTREEVVRAIIESFIAACSTKKLCERLAIAISPGDYKKQAINLIELSDFLEHVCKYTQFKDRSDMGSGTPTT